MAGRCRRCGRAVGVAEDASFIVLDGQRTDDAPLCAECAAGAASELRRAVAELREENESYAALLGAALINERAQQRAAEEAAMSAEEAALAADVAALRAAVAAAAAAADAPRSGAAGTGTGAGAKVLTASGSSGALGAGGASAEAKAGAVWRVAGAVESAARGVSEEGGAVAARLARLEGAVERLRRAAVVNEAFRVAAHGHVATINELRLGRLPPAHDTDWPELNAAFGCTCQLVALLGRLLGVPFAHWQPVPLGSVSRMESLPDHTPYELYGSADLSLSRFFWYRRFDTAQVALALCAAQLADACEKRDAAFKVPYRITADGSLYPAHVGAAGAVSVRLQFNAPDKWSRALKYLLTNLKALLTRV